MAIGGAITVSDIEILVEGEFSGGSIALAAANTLFSASGGALGAYLSGGRAGLAAAAQTGGLHEIVHLIGSKAAQGLVALPGLLLEALIASGEIDRADPR
jgi:hypothetical protein